MPTPGWRYHPAAPSVALPEIVSSFGGPSGRPLSRVWCVAVLEPESFRGGCSFGTNPVTTRLRWSGRFSHDSTNAIRPSRKVRAGRSILHDRLANLTTSFLRAHEPDADDPGGVLPYQEVGAHLREDLAASRESKRASVRENGDDGGHSIGGWVVAGSPPRMRGRRSGSRIPNASNPAHPRECGDDMPHFRER